jgi:TolB protein
MYNRINKVALSLFILISISLKEKGKPESRLEIFDIEKNTHKTVYASPRHLEAPNWVRDGDFLIFNSAGKLFRIPSSGCDSLKAIQINTDFASTCNNDHGVSPDNKEIVISHHEKSTGKSMIYVLPIKGGTPRLVTSNGPSYWHGWAPDGKTLAYCAERNGAFDIYSIPKEGGQETQLTSATGLDDGPDYTADGKYIYFNSVRTGTMKIWRMKPDGKEQEQVTFDEYNDWFAHPSPDGKWLVFLSYDKDVSGHPANKNVMIRMVPLVGGETKILTKLFGGQGTINVPSWSPDSKRFAYVTYKEE